jgi:hypothetical protein
MKLKKGSRRSGFTLLEVLAASVLFIMAISSIISARNRSLRVVSESGLLAQAHALSAMKMTEMEILFQGRLDKEGVRSAWGREEGSFDAPYETFRWSAESVENPLVLKEEQLQMFLQAFGLSTEDASSQIEQSKLLLANLNKALQENMIELRVKVTWDFLGKERDILLVTHLIPKKPKISFTQNTDMDRNFSP